LLSAGAHAELSKWVDTDGKVHYSDLPPPVDAKEKSRLRSGSMPDSGSSIAPAATRSGDSANDKARKPGKKELAEKAAKQQALDEQNKANCTAAQEHLRPLQEGLRIVEFDANGERIYIDDEQRQQRIAKYQQDISQYCK
jgi:hypothetical protein